MLAFALVVVNWGLDSIGTREVAKSPETLSAMQARVTRFRTWLALGMASVILLASLLFHWAPEIAIPLAIIPLVFVRRLDWLLMGVGDQRSVAVAAIAREVVYLALVFTVVLQFKSVAAAAWSMLAAEVAPLVVTTIAAKRHASMARGSVPVQSPQLARAGWPLVVMGIMYLTYTKIDTPLIAHLINAQAAGVYYASYSILFGALSIAAPLSRAAFPEMSRLLGSGTTVAPGMFRLSLLAAGAGALIGVALVVLARPVLGLLYGDRFLVGSGTLQLLSISIMFTFASGVLAQGLVAGGRQTSLAKWTAIAAGTNVLANLFLIPRVGILGAAIATILTEALVLTLTLVSFRQSQEIRAYSIRLFAVLVLFGIACAVGLSTSRISPWLGAGAGSLVFISGYVAVAAGVLRGSRNEWRANRTAEGVLP
jgi:O-antigen/teichoic acid export membrane protein